MGRGAPLHYVDVITLAPNIRFCKEWASTLVLPCPRQNNKPTLSLGRNKNSDGLTPVSIQTPFMGVDFRATKIPRMKRSFDTMSQAMDWASSSAGVRKPGLPRMTMRGGRRKALTRTQRTEVQRIVRSNIELKYFGFNSESVLLSAVPLIFPLPHSWYHKEPPILPELVTSLIGSQ